MVHYIAILDSTGDVFIDAMYYGDLMAKAGVRWPNWRNTPIMMFLVVGTHPEWGARD